MVPSGVGQCYASELARYLGGLTGYSQFIYAPFAIRRGKSCACLSSDFPYSQVQLFGFTAIFGYCYTLLFCILRLDSTVDAWLVRIQVV